MADKKMFRQGKFNFIGTLSASKEPLVDGNMGSGEWKRQRLSVGVRANNSMQFLTMENIHCDKVKTCRVYTKESVGDKSYIEVDRSETTNPSIIQQASTSSLITVDLESDFDKKKEYTSLTYKIRNHENDNRELSKKNTITEADQKKIEENNTKIAEYQLKINELATNRVVFCHMKDAITFLNSALPVIGKSKVKVTGNVKPNFYNGKNVLQYVPSTIELVPEDTTDQLKLYNIDIFYDKDSIDDDKAAKKLIVNGYIGERKNKKDKLLPLVVVIDYNNIDEENEEQKAMLDFMKSTFAIVDKKSIHRAGVEINVINGSEVVEFSIDCLTEQQKASVKLGFKKLDDYRPRGNVYGDRVQELRVCCPDLKEYPDGAEVAFGIKELGEYLAEDDSDITESKAKEDTKVVENTSKQEQTQEDKLKALFG